MSRKPSASTCQDVLRLAGMTLYGAEWKHDLAVALVDCQPTDRGPRRNEVHFLRDIDVWLAGVQVPNWVFAALGETISDQIEDLEDIRDQVGRMIG